MLGEVLVPLGGRLVPEPFPDPEPGDPVLWFEVVISVRVDVSSEESSAFFPRADRTTVVSIEDVDLGVDDWRQLGGREVVIPDDTEMDAAIYLAGIHNPVRLRRLRFGPAGEQSIAAEVDLQFDFRYVNPRPPELPKSLDVSWRITFDVDPADEANS